MVLSVNDDNILYNELPYKFEAGTPNVMGAVGLHAAIKFIDDIGFDHIKKHEVILLAMLLDGLRAIPDLRVMSSAKDSIGVVSFVMDGCHPHDIGTILDRLGVAIRAGHHCAQPLMHAMCVNSTARVSIGCYNTEEDIVKFLDSLKSVKKVLHG